MKKSCLSILCTAYCNTIMPQIDNNVDNICNSYNESSNNMYENFFKKRLITVPVSHIYHTIIISTSTILIMLSWVVLTHWRIINCLSMNSNKKKGQNARLDLFSLLLSHSCTHFDFSRVCSHVHLLVEKYIHMIYKKKYNDDKHRHEVQASSSAFFTTPPTPRPPDSSYVSISV